MFGNNPIMYNDPLLDILKVGNGNGAEQAKTDIKELTKGVASNGEKVDGSKYVEFGKDGTTSLNFGDLKTGEINNLLKQNIGLRLLNDMINAKDENNKDISFLYTANDNQEFKDANNPSMTLTPKYFYSDGSSASMPRSSSVTPKFLNGGFYKRDGKYFSRDEDIKPLNNFNGMINAPASIGFLSRRVPFLMIRRASIVYHEMRENFYRTVYKLFYSVPGPAAPNSSQSFIPASFGAHNKSSLDEGSFYGNPDPGGYQKEVKLK